MTLFDPEPLEIRRTPDVATWNGGDVTMRPRDHATARVEDPATSHEAAESVTHVAAKQDAVFLVVYDHGPLSLSQLVELYDTKPDLPVQSPSGIRTRCAELVAAGRVEVCGERVNVRGRKERLLRARAL